MSQTRNEDPIIGQTFGNVVAKSILGRGGMGAVYLGHHPGLDMEVAIKLLPDLFVGKREMVERFLREARVSGKLQHPNIVRTLDVGRDHGVYYLVMEYVKGVDAQRLLDRETRFTPMRAVNIAGFVARALGEAHDQGVIHRDIKPANILIARDGKVKVTDFGLARSITNTATALTLSNQVVGTPNYMAPEQIKSMEVDARVDIYALGVTLWQFLTGRLPFDGATPMAVLLNVVGENLTMPREVFEPLPKELREAVVAMTAKDPRRRLPNIPAVLAVLKKARDALRNAGLDSTAPLQGVPRASSPSVKSISDAPSASRVNPLPPRNDPQSFTKPLGSELNPRSSRPGTKPPTR
jgi:eukaryotic-like serine/threonine-protein kinase